MTEAELKDLEADCKEAAADLTMILKYVQDKYPSARFTVSVEHFDIGHPVVTIEGDAINHSTGWHDAFLNK